MSKLQWTKKETTRALLMNLKPYEFKKDLTMSTNEEKALKIMDENNTQIELQGIIKSVKEISSNTNKNKESFESMKKHLNSMADSLSQVLEMMNALRLTNIRLSERIGKVEQKAIVLPGQVNGSVN